MNTNELRELLGKEAPNMLTAVGIVSSFTSIIFAIKATIGATEQIALEGLSDLEFKEKIKAVWKHYIPTALMLTLNISCVMGVYLILSKRNKTLSGLYLVAVEGLREYQAQVFELVGEKRHAKVLEKIAENQLEKKPLSSDAIVIQAGGDVLFFDAYSGRYFLSTIETIKSAMNEFNHRLFSEMFLSLNEFYDLIGVSPIDAGDGMGWGIEQPLDISFTAQIVHAPKSVYDKQPCIVLNYELMPHYLSR